MLYLLCVKMGGSCDPGESSDGSRLAIYKTLSYRVPLFVLRVGYSVVV